MDESVHLVIANGRVVDGTGERPAFLADVAVSKRSGKIVEVGPGLVAKYPHARIVDAVGKYVTPGFVDIHTSVIQTSECFRFKLQSIFGWEFIAWSGNSVKFFVHHQPISPTYKT